MDKNHNQDWNELLQLVQENELGKIVMAQLMEEDLFYEIKLRDFGIYDSYDWHQPVSNSISIRFDKERPRVNYIKISLNMEDGEYVIWVERDKDQQKKQYCKTAYSQLKPLPNVHRSLSFYNNNDESYDFKLYSFDKKIVHDFIKGFIDLI